MVVKKFKESLTKTEAISEGDLGAYLRISREHAGLSQGDVAKLLKMSQFQSLSQWERNASGSVPIKTLLKLAEIYKIKIEEMYEVLLKYQSKRMEEKLKTKFFGKSKKTRTG